MIGLDARDICLGLLVVGVCLMLFVQFATGEVGEDEEQRHPDFQEGWKP